MPQVFLAVTDPLIALLKADFRVQDVVDDRVFAGTPFGLTTTPWVTVTRIGGSPSTNPTPEDLPIILFTAWAGIKEQLVAEQTAAALATAVASFEEQCPVTQDGVIFFGAYILPGSGPRFLHDPDDDRARYVFQARYTCMAADQT